jgi:hypothetical protein
MECQIVGKQNQTSDIGIPSSNFLKKHLGLGFTNSGD